MVAITPFSVLVSIGDSIQCEESFPNVPPFSSIFSLYMVWCSFGCTVVTVLQTLGCFMSDYSHYTIPLIQFSHNNKIMILTRGLFWSDTNWLCGAYHSKEGVAAVPSKLCPIQEWPVPHSVQDLLDKQVILLGQPAQLLWDPEGKPKAQLDVRLYLKSKISYS